jgi:hypothetical protein
MEFSWKNDLSDSLRSRISEKARSLLADGNAITLTIILNSLVLMKYDWKNADVALEEVICQGIIACFHPTKGQIGRNTTRTYVDCIRYLGWLLKDKKYEDIRIVFNNDVLSSFWNGIESRQSDFAVAQRRYVLEG